MRVESAIPILQLSYSICRFPCPRAGRLLLEKLVRTYPCEGINEAIDDMEAGYTAKPVLLMPLGGNVFVRLVRRLASPRSRKGGKSQRHLETIGIERSRTNGKATPSVDDKPGPGAR